MEQHKQEIGTKKDLVLYRLETAKKDLKSAKVLLEIDDCKGANNRAYYAIFLFMQLMQYTLFLEKPISVIKMPLLISIKIMLKLLFFQEK